MKYCTNCKNVNKDSDRFCRVCGAQLDVVYTVGQNKSNNNALKIIIAVLSIFLVLIIAASALYVYSERKKEETQRIETQVSEKLAKEAVKNFAYAYESFVNSGLRNESSYYNYVSQYSPSWSSAYINQWNYFSRNNITYYNIENLTFESVTSNGNEFYVIDVETITENRRGIVSTSTTRWKYTVVKEDDSYMVTSYQNAN